MGAATSVFGKSAPNVYALERLINRYEELKPQGLSMAALYSELDKELTALSATTQLKRSTSSTESEAFDSPVAADHEATEETARILVVDDSSISCKLAKRALSTLNFRTSVAESGEEALNLLSEHPYEFDLVLLDILMPKMDGLQVLSRIKSSPLLQHVPVAMLSGLEDQTLAEACLQQGAVEVLLKPLKTDAVAKVVREHCKRRHIEITAGAWPAHGEIDIGDVPRPFTLAATDFSSVSMMDTHPGKKILLVFFPAAFISAGYKLGCNQLLQRVNRHYLALKAANTEVLAIGKELPYTLSALKRRLELPFALLSDATLAASSHFIGTNAFGDLLLQLSGVHIAGLTDYRTCNAGLVLLDEDRKVMYKWIPTNLEAQQEVLMTAELQKIFALLRDQEPVVSDASPSDTRPTIRNAGRASILVIDDSTISSKLAVRKLTSMGHDAMHAENGQLALELLHRFPGDFDLVLLDIVMPVMDGVEVLTAIKHDPKLRDIPVVMLSGLEDEVLADVCLKAGAADVFKKPLEMQKVQQLLTQLRSTVNGHP